MNNNDQHIRTIGLMYLACEVLDDANIHPINYDEAECDSGCLSLDLRAQADLLRLTLYKDKEEQFFLDAISADFVRIP